MIPIQQTTFTNEGIRMDGRTSRTGSTTALEGGGEMRVLMENQFPGQTKREVEL